MKIFIKTFLSLLLITLLTSGAYALYLYNSVSETVEEMYYPIEKETKSISMKKIDKKESITFLVLGIDSKESGFGRSDAIMVVTVNPNNNSSKMVSIPRDTLTTIVGKGFKDKINHAYAFGGPEMAIATTENFLDIPIDHFASINMWGFIDMIDAIGGVEVDNDFSFTQNDIYFEKGTIELNGFATLAYVRHRKTDPKGDLGRNERQKQVIKSVINKILDNPSKIKDVLEVLGNNVKTDLTFNQIMTLLSEYIGAKDNISSISVDGSSKKINGVYYYQVPEEERQRISKELKDNLSTFN